MLSGKLIILGIAGFLIYRILLILIDIAIGFITGIIIAFLVFIFPFLLVYDAATGRIGICNQFLMQLEK